MDFAKMSTTKLAETLRNAYSEWQDGGTPEIRAAGERTYKAAKAHIASQPKPSWRR